MKAFIAYLFAPERRIFTVGVLINIILIWQFAMPARSNPMDLCAPRDVYIEQLADKYGEARIGQGLTPEGLLFQLFASPKGTWTILILRPDGIACPLAVGTDWESFKLPAVGVEG